MAKDTWSVAEPVVLELEGVTEVKVAIFRGQIDVIAHEGDTTVVDVQAVDATPVDVTLEDGVLKVTNSAFNWDALNRSIETILAKPSATVSILVPVSTTARISTVSGSVMVDGPVSDPSVKSVSGSVILNNVTGKASVNTISGDTSVQHLIGDLAVDTVSGDTTATGTISKFRSNGVSGDVFLDLDGSPRSIDANTVSGNISARVPEPLVLSILSNSASGTLQVGGRTVKGFRGGGYRWNVEGTSTHTLSIKTNTVSGDTTILRADVPSAQTTADQGGAS